MTSLPAQFFATARLIFRPFAPDDLDALAEIGADPVVNRFVGDGKPSSRSETAEWIVRSRENVARHGSGTGAVVLRETGTLIGWAGIARPADGPPELIYGVARDYWRRGLGRELIEALVPWAEGMLGKPAEATVHMQNTVSIALLERAGFELVDCRTAGDGTRVGRFRRSVRAQIREQAKKRLQ